jgi:ribosomal protein S17
LPAVYFSKQKVQGGMAVEILVGKEKLGINNVMKVGDRVRIIESVVVYHHPEHRGQAFDLKGSEGEVDAIVTQWQGRPVSANLPIVVKLSKKFKAHLRENELEII